MGDQLEPPIKEPHFISLRKMADRHPGAPPPGGGVPAIGPAPNPAGDAASTTTMVIMPPSPAATRLFSDVRKGLEKSATGKFWFQAKPNEVLCVCPIGLLPYPCLWGRERVGWEMQRMIIGTTTLFIQRFMRAYEHAGD